MQIDWTHFTGLSDYDTLHNLMIRKVDLIAKGAENSQIWILEHNDIYTAGTSAKEDELLPIYNNIPVRYIGRGGKFTYHGPGQRIIYLLINLREFFAFEKVDIKKFVSFLENWIIESLEVYNIKSKKSEGRIGIWVKKFDTEEKIAAIGIRVSKGITYHGISINIKPELNKFNGIIPCGISEFGVTSIYKELYLLESYNDFTQKFDNILKDIFYQLYKRTFSINLNYNEISI